MTTYFSTDNLGATLVDAFAASLQGPRVLCQYAGHAALDAADDLASFWTLFLEWRGLTDFAKISSGSALLMLIVLLVILIISGVILAVLLGMAAAQYGMTF
ncbi:MAG: hypothetical protein ACE5F3_07580 [Mariprofundaceae bacterium]